MKVRCLIGAQIQTAAIGLEGAPYVASAGSVIELDEKCFKILKDKHPPGTFEIIEGDKPKKRERKERKF